MHQYAQKTELRETRIMTGTVRLDFQGAFVLETELGPVQARRAAGCLAWPHPGDLVLLAWQAPDRAWILSLLETATPGPTLLRCEDGLSIETGEECLRLSGQSLEMTAAAEIRSAAPAWNLAADRGAVRMREFSFVGRAVSAAVEGLSLLSGRMDATVRTLTQKFGRVFRRVEDLERVSARQVRLDVGEGWTLQAGTCRVAASEKVKMDAPKIDLG